MPVPWLVTQAIKFGIADPDNPHDALGERPLKVIERGLVVLDTPERDGAIVCVGSITLRWRRDADDGCGQLPNLAVSID